MPQQTNSPAGSGLPSTPSSSSSTPRSSSQATKIDASGWKEAAVSGSKEIGGEVKDLAGEAVAEAKRVAEKQITTRKQRAIEALGTVANALRHTGHNLSEQDEGDISDYALRAAERVEKASVYLDSRSFTQVKSDIESFARREPALFFGGALVAGILGGRFLRSSTPERTRPHGNSPYVESRGSYLVPPERSVRDHGGSGTSSSNAPRGVGSRAAQTGYGRASAGGASETERSSATRDAATESIDREKAPGRTAEQGTGQSTAATTPTTSTSVKDVPNDGGTPKLGGNVTTPGTPR